MADAMRKTRAAVVDQLDRHAADVGRALDRPAIRLNEIGESQRRAGNVMRGRVIELAAAMMRSLASYLQTSSGERIVSDVGDRAREGVPVMATLGLLGGFATARAVRSRMRHARGNEA